MSAAIDLAERQHPRVPANFMVKVFVKNRTLLAKASELSMAGLFVTGDTELDEDSVVMSVPLPNDREMVATARVRRRSPKGTALEFTDLDWDDLLALARYLHPRLR
jgi:hypothetical protein